MCLCDRLHSYQQRFEARAKPGFTDAQERTKLSSMVRQVRIGGAEEHERQRSSLKCRANPAIFGKGR